MSDTKYEPGETKLGLKGRDLVINKYTPFHNDCLNREENARTLTKFIETANESMVLCINAPWGQGKTTFLKMWQQDLINNGFPTVYFNSWENDFYDDALICLIGELESASESIGREFNSLKKIKEFGLALSKRTVPLVVKALTKKFVDDDDLKSLLADLAESTAREQLEKYSKAKDTIQGFKENLVKFAQEFAQELAHDDKPQPLIFIIDELDRCRPNFSIEILEKAKHFFNVDNVIFVLGVHKGQLGSSFKAVYGQDLDVANYLRRFIDFEYTLPAPKTGAFTKMLFHRFNIRNLLEQGEMPEDNIEECLSELFSIFNLTLRQQEECCALLALAIRVSDKKEDLLLAFLGFLIVIKVGFSDLYTEWKAKEAPLKEALIQSKRLSSFNKEDSFFWKEIKEYAKCIDCSEMVGTPGEPPCVYLYLYEQEINEDFRRFDEHTLDPDEAEYQKRLFQLRKTAVERISKRLYKGEDVLKLLLSRIDLVSSFI